MSFNFDGFYSREVATGEKKLAAVGPGLGGNGYPCMF